MASKVLLLEFNEICPTLLDRWFAAGKLPNFRKLYEQSDVFVSIADETDPVNLEPWIQWYSIHTGLPYAEHRVFHLTDGPKAGHADLWQRVERAGKSAMNCSSMNAKGPTNIGAFSLPDPWCPVEACSPPEIAVYANVVANWVREYSNARVPVTWRDYAGFLRFIVGHGLSASTCGAIIAQLIRDNCSLTGLSWRRVALLDRLQFDLFAHYYRRLTPAFATFFSNSTAHLQHAYWRHMDPSAFAIKPPKRESELYGDAVLFGYEAMDRLIGRFLGLIDRDTTLILCSALSQQPFLKWETKGGQHFYRLHDVDRFIAMLDAPPLKVAPVMTHQYLVRFADQQAMTTARDRMRIMSVDGTALFGVQEAPDNSLEFGCQLFGSLTGDETLEGLAQSNRPLRFNDLFYPIEAVKSGCHHPDGVLWFRTGSSRVHPGRASIVDIAPTICELLHVDRSGLPGTDLLAGAWRERTMAPRQLAYPN